MKNLRRGDNGSGSGSGDANIPTGMSDIFGLLGGSKGSGSTIWVNSFDEFSAKDFVEQIELINRKKKYEKVLVMIDSYGGEAYSLFAMLDAIEMSEKPVWTCTIGKAMSCGGVLLSAGDYRFATPNSTIMLHEVSGGTWGKTSELVADTAEAQRLNDLMISMLAKNCGKTIKQMQKDLSSKQGGDIYLSAKDALAFGIIDKIGSPKLVKKISIDFE